MAAWLIVCRPRLAGVFAADFYGEGVVEAEWLAYGEIETLLIFCLDLVVDFFTIGAGRFFQDCGQGGAGVFGIDIDAASEDGLLADVGAGQIEAALDWQMGFVFDLLGDYFSED